MIQSLLWLLMAALPSPPSDTLVVCPLEFRPALASWVHYRQQQGHVLEIVAPPRTARELHDTVNASARNGHLKAVILIGDVDRVPTSYAPAKVNILWGSEATIATDQLYADVDGDGVPDVAVGRLPVDTAEELQAVVRKLMQYESSADNGSRRRQIDVVAGVGGFGIVADALIEASARNVFTQVVPRTYAVRRLPADPEATCRQISAGSLAWIYLGHGLPTMLDVASTPSGPRPILDVKDVPTLQCGANRPLAVLVACYTGAIDARADSLAEELMLEERGPVAVVAATRVTMPYGNSVLGCELLRAAFQKSPGNMGDIWLRAQQRTLASASADDPLRTSLDAVARGVSPPSADLAAERREHVLLYQLLGDPLMRLKYPDGGPPQTARIAAGNQEQLSR